MVILSENWPPSSTRHYLSQGTHPWVISPSLGLRCTLLLCNVIREKENDQNSSFLFSFSYYNITSIYECLYYSGWNDTLGRPRKGETAFTYDSSLCWILSFASFGLIQFTSLAEKQTNVVSLEVFCQTEELICFSVRFLSVRDDEKGIKNATGGQLRDSSFFASVHHQNFLVQILSHHVCYLNWGKND